MPSAADQLAADAADAADVGDTAVACPACRVPLSAPRDVRRVDSRVLLEGSRELVIEHHGNRYHLRVTRSDKLILTK